ncbi:hypothetical protein P7C70_g551, partial [Phenoliferia sp. Uapishka_3]
MSTSPSLPAETLTSILRHAITAAREVKPPRHYPLVLTLCLVSRQFRDIAQPLLYRHVHLHKQSTAVKLLSSPAFGTHRIEELDLIGYYNAREEGVTAVTGTALIEAVGRVGLRKLSLRSFIGLDATVVELAGAGDYQRYLSTASLLIYSFADLASLDIDTILTRNNPPLRWTFPFNLSHLSLHGCSAPADFMSALLSSSSNSLHSFEATGISSLNISNLPEFPSFARRITTLALGREFVFLLKSLLSSFTAVTHLIFNNCLKPSVIANLLDAVPAETPTITQLTLSFDHHSFEHKFDGRLRDAITNSKSMTLLEDCTFSEIHVKHSSIVLDLFVGDRKIRMHFEGKCWTD